MNAHTWIPRLIGSPSGRSFLWLAADRTVRIILSIFVGFWVARYLGPERFGLFNYALAAVALMGPLAELGLDAVARREFVQHPEQGPVLAGTILRLRLMGGLVAFGVIAAWAFWPGIPSDQQRLFAILSLATLQPVGMVAESWLQSRLEARRSVVSQWGALLAGAIARVGAVLSGCPLEVFAGISVLEIGLVAVLVIRSAKRKGMQFGRFNPTLARTLLAESWPLALSSVSVIIYMKIDILMIRSMSTEAETGTYAAAVRLSELGYFIPVIIGNSIQPILTRGHAESTTPHQLYKKYIRYSALGAYAIAIPTSILAPWVTHLTYGAQYTGTETILSIHAWAIIFVCLGVARSQYLVNMGLTRFSLQCTAIGALANIGLNWWLIPKHGGLGAAVATVVSYATSAWLMSFVSPQVRQIGWMQTKALAWPLLFWSKRC